MPLNAAELRPLFRAARHGADLTPFEATLQAAATELPLLMAALRQQAAHTGTQVYDAPAEVLPARSVVVTVNV